MQADQNVDKNKQRCKNQHLHEDTGVEGCVPHKHRFRRRHRCNDAIAFHKHKYIHAMYPCFMAIDTEKEYMIFAFTDVTYCDVVASSDPEVDPYAIEEHFERFIELRANAQMYSKF